MRVAQRGAIPRQRISAATRRANREGCAAVTGIAKRLPERVASTREATLVAKVVCVLYPDPVDGYPKAYARDDIHENHYLRCS